MEIESDGFDCRVVNHGPGYDGWPLVLLRLEAVGVERLRELVTDAWRMRGY